MMPSGPGPGPGLAAAGAVTRSRHCLGVSARGGRGESPPATVTAQRRLSVALSQWRRPGQLEPGPARVTRVTVTVGHSSARQPERDSSMSLNHDSLSAIQA
jgi:hypothetical protein